MSSDQRQDPAQPGHFLSAAPRRRYAAGPAHLRIDTATFLGDQDIPVERYIDPRIPRAREGKALAESLADGASRGAHPRVGDADVYDINDISILIVRIAPDQIKAYYNACLHMGRQLLDGPAA